MHNRRFWRQRGFTLIELLVTIAVIAILAGVAIPSFTSQIRDNRSLAYGDEFVSAINFARSEAVKRGRLVSLCASNDDQTDCGADWDNGWLAVLDSADETSNAVDVDDSDTDVLRVWDDFGEGMTLAVNRDGATSFVRFTPQGGLPRNSDQSVTAMAKHEDCSGASARSVRITAAGSVRAISADC